MNKIIYILLLFLSVNATGQITIDSQANLQIYKNDTCITDKVPPQRIFAAQHGARLDEMVVLTKNVYDSLNERINNITGGEVTLPQLTDSMSDIRTLINSNYTYLDSVDSVVFDDLDNKVPYTGATGNVDLGDHSLTADRLNADTLEPNNSSGIHLHDKSHNDIFIAAAGGGNNLTIYAPTIFSLMANQSETDTVLGTSSTGLIKKIGIASTYLKKTDTATVIATRPWVQSLGYLTTAVTSVSAGWGMSFTTITSTGSVTVDSTQAATKALVQKKVDSLIGIGYITASYLMRTFTTTNFTTSVTINADSYNNYRVTAQTGNLQINISASSPFHGQIVTFDVNGDGSAHTVSYGASVNNTGSAPTSISATATTTRTWVFRYNGSGYWDFVNSFEISH